MLWLLLLIDTLFLALHMAVTGFALLDEAPASANWARIDRDNSVSEIYEYLKFAMASGLLISLSIARRRPNLLPLALIMAILIVDNMLSGHETLGPILVPGHQNYGELLYFVLLLLVCLVLTWIGFRNATPLEKKQMLAIWAGILVLGGFGVGVDAVHAKLVGWGILWADRWMGLVEDFGELVAITFILGACLSFARRQFGGSARTAIRRADANPTIIPAPVAATRA